MQCNRCGHELPSDTPVCPQCGPVTLGAGYAPPPPPPPLSLPPLPSIEIAPGVPPLMPMADPTGPAAPVTPAVPAPPFSPAAPAAPTAASKADLKRARKQRAREAMAARDRGQEAAPEDETPLVALERPSPITQMAVVDLAVGAAKLLVASSVLAGQIAGPTEGAMRLLLNALLLLVAGLGLWTLRPFGRYAQFAVAAATLYSGLLALAVAIPIVIYLARPGVALLLSGREPGQLDAQQRRRIREDTESPRLVPIAVGLYALVSVIGLWSPLGALFSR